ncbi:NAD-dependent histone deacetylase [Podospora conica]|nr:NAD-dependent histone deacetylase [Schizothecium conicum]
MGQEQSVISDDTPPETLRDRSLAAVAEHIKSGKARRVVVMTGAGISTAAGIPDFRSPETGLYANLAKLKLPHPEAVFDLDFFRQNPEPFYVLAKDLYPGHFHPTVSHVFIHLLSKKGLLLQLFTQNIDCLERAAGIPDDLIVEAHGSFAHQRCIECKTPYPEDLMREHVRVAKVPRCLDEACRGLVKPDIVFFHEAMPSLFYDRRELVDQADLVLILGTSLQVHPFASLPSLVRDSVPRVLFNMERVGGLGSQADDVLELGDCDTGVRKLADALGWRDELEAEWRALVGEAEATRQLSGMGQRTEQLRDEVDRLAEAVDEALHLGREEDANAVDSYERAQAKEKGGPEEEVEGKEGGKEATDGPSAEMRGDDAVRGPGESGKDQGGQKETKGTKEPPAGLEVETPSGDPAGTAPKSDTPVVGHSANPTGEKTK